MSAGTGVARKLGILWTLYFVQGLPFGFTATALPTYLRDADVSRTLIGLATVVALPWSLKIFWAPLVDRFGSRKFGRRRSWILPLQLALGLVCTGAAAISPDEELALLLLSVLLMNLFAATMDVAVDGLAVDLLEYHELGVGNIAQVVGYKIGMLTGGGLLLWASGRIGYQGLFLSMAVLVGLSALVTLVYKERHHRDRQLPGSPLDHPKIADVLSLLKRSLVTPGAGWLLLFIGTYKLGENMADTMFKPFLVDAGYSGEQIGLWVGTWGMLFSIAGSTCGGLLARRWPLLKVVALAAALRALPVAGEWWLSVVEPTEPRVIFVTCAEHFFGGALTVALFAFMMSRVDKRIGATHYTALAAVEVWGKQPAAMVSGWITDATSYPFIFGLAFVLSAAFLLLLLPLFRRQQAGMAETGESGRL